MVIMPWTYRRLSEVFFSAGLTFLVAINEKIYNVKMAACGDPITRHEKTVVIMNHRTRLDWMYLFSFLYHSRVLNRQKITLKAAIKWIPVLGWSLQTAGYIFLNRKAEDDEKYIRRSLTYFEELGCKPNILIFPEGTDLSPGNLKRSWAYSKEKGLPKYDYVLHPRIKGFVWYVQTLRQVGGIQAVHDITVAYPDDIVCNEKDVILGRLPHQVHFHVKRYPISDLPMDENGLAEWIKRRWNEKEERLREFYSKPMPRKFEDVAYMPSNSFRAAFLWVVLFGFFMAMCLFVKLLACSWLFRTYCTLAILFCVQVTRKFGGICQLEMYMYEKLHKSADKWAQKKNA